MSNKRYQVEYIVKDGLWWKWKITGPINRVITGKSKGVKKDIESKLNDWITKTNDTLKLNKS